MEKGIFVTGILDKLDSEIMWLTKSSVDIAVKVSFEDAGDNDSIRPDEAAVKLSVDKAPLKADIVQMTVTISRKWLKDGEPIEYTVEASDYIGHEKNITENAKNGFFETYTHELFAGLKKIAKII